jgi:hypothetical protein
MGYFEVPYLSVYDIKFALLLIYFTQPDTRRTNMSLHPLVLWTESRRQLVQVMLGFMG